MHSNHFLMILIIIFNFIHIDTSYRIDGKKFHKDSFKLFKFFFLKVYELCKKRKKFIFEELEQKNKQVVL